jgi:hypothetical protein
MAPVVLSLLPGLLCGDARDALAGQAAGGGVTEGERSAAEALKRLEPCRRWVWTAIDPVSTVLLALAVGPRTVEMAQRVVPQVGWRFASPCMPL